MAIDWTVIFKNGENVMRMVGKSLKSCDTHPLNCVTWEHIYTCLCIFSFHVQAERTKGTSTSTVQIFAASSSQMAPNTPYKPHTLLFQRTAWTPLTWPLFPLCLMSPMWRYGKVIVNAQHILTIWKMVALLVAVMLTSM